MREALWLVRGGVPFDIAFELDEMERAAWCIILSEQEGRTFNWNRMKFDDND